MTAKQAWVIKPLPDNQTIERLREQINVSKPIATMLLQRGIASFDDAKTFFTPSIEYLHNPFLMKDMDRAVERLIQAVDTQEGVLIYGDYDVDGTTSVALVYSFLKEYLPNLHSYIPDRYTEGYGVSEAGIAYAKEHKLSLIISLDCGIKAHQHVANAKEQGIDFIICDHHTPAAMLPEAYAVLDPKRSDCQYPYKELTGCGVGFKLLQAFCQKQGVDFQQLFPYLDLLAISTACDIVPITGENRVLCKFGLDVINSQPRVGVKALMESASFKSKLNISNLVFGLGPRINAAGRIEHGKYAVELLCEKDEAKALAQAQVLNENNDTRREFDSSITDQALEMIKELGNDDACSTVLYHPDWHKGVIGIVASRCIEHYYRPTIILTESNGKATGSARSVKDFSIYEALCECEDLLEQFGGHDYAAGMTLAIENVPAFQEKFEKVVCSRISKEQLIPKIMVDAEIELGQITPNFFKILSRMAPFGPQNRSPVFVARNVYPIYPPRLLKEAHVKMKLGQQGSSLTFDTIAFRRPDIFPKVAVNQPFDICFTVEENTYNGNTTLQLLLKDIDGID